MNRYVDKKTGHSETTVKEIQGERRAAVFDNTLTYANRVGCVLKDNGHLHIRNFVSYGQSRGLETLIYIADQWGDASNGDRRLHAFTACLV